MSEVDGLGFYLLCCLGFVFSALVEFTIITMLKQKKRTKRLFPLGSKGNEHKKLMEFGPTKADDRDLLIEF